MKKNVIIIVLVILTIISGVTSLVSQIEVKKFHELNEVSMREAALQREIAEEQTLIAQINADSARVAHDRAELYKKLAEKTMEDLQMAKLEIEKCK